MNWVKSVMKQYDNGGTDYENVTSMRTIFQY